MALWNQATPEVSPEKPQPVPPGLTPTPTATTTAPSPAPTPVVPATKESAPSGRRESVFGPGVTIEGKIEGDADIRIAGKFKGDIQIKGDLNLDKGAKVSAKVQAANVTIGGELEGNVVAGAQVKLLSRPTDRRSQAAALTVVAGSRMRGHVELAGAPVKSPSLPTAKSKRKKSRSRRMKAGQPTAGESRSCPHCRATTSKARRPVRCAAITCASSQSAPSHGPSKPAAAVGRRDSAKCQRNRTLEYYLLMEVRDEAGKVISRQSPVCGAIPQRRKDLLLAHRDNAA